jgi:hypothetical protein
MGDSSLAMRLFSVEQLKGRKRDRFFRKIT